MIHSFLSFMKAVFNKTNCDMFWLWLNICSHCGKKYWGKYRISIFSLNTSGYDFWSISLSATTNRPIRMHHGGTWWWIRLLCWRRRAQTTTRRSQFGRKSSNQVSNQRSHFSFSSYFMLAWCLKSRTLHHCSVCTLQTWCRSQVL